MIARHADDDQEMLRAVGSFLERCGHIKAMWALEKSSGVATFLHGRDVAFVRELLMDGAFDEVQHFLKALQGSINAKDYNEAVFVVRRQQFLELLSGEMLTIVVMLVVDIFAYGLIAQYLDLVLPRQGLELMLRLARCRHRHEDADGAGADDG